MMKFIDNFPLPMLLVLTVLMLGAPFVPEPHLIEKARLLSEGALSKPLDWFDVLWHLTPAILLGVKLVRARRARVAKAAK